MKLLLIIMFILFSSATSAKQQITTIQLNHRLSQEILTDVQAFLPKGATARAHNEFIILKAKPKTIREIKKLIHKLDTPPQRLKISVLQTDEVLSEQHDNHLSGNISVYDGGANTSVNIKRWSTNKSQNKERSYQAQTIAGKPTLIMLGQDIPQKEQLLYINPNGAMTLQSSTSYISLNNGFQAIARVLPNNQVSIEVHPSFASLDPRTNRINTSNIISTITGAEGSWLELGQIDNEKNIEKQDSTSYHTHRQQQQTVYIKIEQLK